MAESKPGTSVNGKASNRCGPDHESEREMFDEYRHFEMLSTGRRVPLSKAMDRYEGLSCLSGYPWSETSVKADLPWQFGPGNPLDFESQYITVEESSLLDIPDAALADSKKATEVELEWQWIMDQQQASKCEWFSSTNVTKNNTKEDDVVVSADKDAKEDVKLDVEISTASSLFSSSKAEGSSDAGTSRSSKVSGNLSVQLNAAKLSKKPGAVWLTADSKELAALVSQKGHGYLENCDLPPSQGSLTWKGPLARCDVNLSKANRSGSSLPSGKVLQASAHCGYESNSLENRSLPASPFAMSLRSPTQMHDDSPSTSQPQAIPSATEQPPSAKSCDDRTPSWKARSGGGRVGVTKHGVEALGEALCHSQTRARQAETLAAQASQEREKLAQLLFRESWTARTYKQWVQTLELENTWLKVSAGNDDTEAAGHEFSDPSNASHSRVLHPYKHVRKRAAPKKVGHHVPTLWQSRRHRHVGVPESSVWLQCTIGLAFALGLSFAGAGLMIGWSMGWILLAY